MTLGSNYLDPDVISLEWFYVHSEQLTSMMGACETDLV